MTYERLAELTGIARGTLHQMGRRLDYHPTLTNVEKLCAALESPLDGMIEIVPDPPKPKPKRQAKSPKAAKRR
ncbi:MAG: helix-turn-helix domain-containing protein [Phycisphaerae bacterium]